MTPYPQPQRQEPLVLCRSLTTRDDPTKHLTEPQNYVRNANAQTLASNVPVCVYLGLVLANFQGSMLQGPGEPCFLHDEQVPRTASSRSQTRQLSDC